MYLPHIVKHITNLECIRLGLKFVFVGLSHDESVIRFYPCLVGGTDTLPSGNAKHVGPTDTLIILHFWVNVKLELAFTPYAVYIPQAKAWGFDGGVLRNKF